MFWFATVAVKTSSSFVVHVHFDVVEVEFMGFVFFLGVYIYIYMLKRQMCIFVLHRYAAMPNGDHAADYGSSSEESPSLPPSGLVAIIRPRRRLRRSRAAVPTRK